MKLVLNENGKLILNEEERQEINERFYRNIEMLLPAKKVEEFVKTLKLFKEKMKEKGISTADLISFIKQNLG